MFVHMLLMVVDGCYWLLMVDISCCLVAMGCCCLVVIGCWWLFGCYGLLLFGCYRLLLFRCYWLLVVVIGCWWLLLVVVWLLMVVVVWLLMVVVGHPVLSRLPLSQRAAVRPTTSVWAVHDPTLTATVAVETHPISPPTYRSCFPRGSKFSVTSSSLNFQLLLE